MIYLFTHFKFEWSRFIINGIFGEYPQVNVTKDDIILVDDAAYLGNFSEKFSSIVNDTKQIK
jgi:hypothetical protein